MWETPIVRVNSASRIIGFWHIGAIGDWQRIVAEQYQKLRDSGLYDASSKIVVGFIGGSNCLEALDPRIRNDAKFDLFVTADVLDYEFPTLARLWSEATTRKELFLCYYFHTKGASLFGTPSHAPANAWRVYMEYFNIEKWQDCVLALNEHETCGVELQCEESHYSGNFWWATSAYVRRLPNGHLYWNDNRHDRLAAEFYVCLARPKAYSFGDFVENLYEYCVPPERYRKQVR